MKEMPKAGFVCVGENALELSGAICCAGRLMRYFNENGYATGGCYSCIAPEKQPQGLKKRVINLCVCCDVVLTVGCEGFRKCDVMPDITEDIGHRTVAHLAGTLCGDSYKGQNGKTIKCFPSRAVAVMYEGCLLLNLPSDVKTAMGRISAIMGEIGYIVGTSGTKRAFQPVELAELTANYYYGENFQS